MPIERKLAAIMFTDIAGYTEQMSKSESKTLNLLEKKRSILKPLLNEYKGTFVKEIGDGTLSYFESAVNAATCAVKLQETTYDDKDMNIRVGIHIGDIVFKDGDVFGGGVNVASRLESIAPAGGVCVSKSVFDELSNQDDFDGIELGLQSLKGVGRLVEVFGLKGEKLNEPNPNEYKDNKIAVHSDDEVPSIAIIPFDNKGADEDVFYTYGISSDLISDCSSAGKIRVAGLKDIEKLDYGNLNYEELSQKLLVRYIAQGTLWKMDDMFQLSIELYDTNESNVVWSDRWQEDWENLPTIKANLSDGVLKALDIKSIIEKKVDTTNTEAYEFYLKGKYKYEKRKNVEDTEIARGFYKKAIALDNNLIMAKIWLGWTFYLQGDNIRAMEIHQQSLKQAKKICDKQSIGYSLNGIGTVYLANNEYEKALDYFQQSLDMGYEIDDKWRIAGSLSNIGNVYKQIGDYDLALDFTARSIKIREKYGEISELGSWFGIVGEINIHKGNFAKALENLNFAIEKRDNIDMHWLAWIYYNLGYYYLRNSQYENAIGYLEKSLNIQNDIDEITNKPETSILLYLSYKNIGKNYDEKEVYELIKDKDVEFEYYINFVLYQLEGETATLEFAYNQVQELADNLEPKVAAKFLSYPIPKAIVEEWEKVK